ncbi:MAG: ABC transporter substrate-binding protein [Chloroflexi bacterium]|nr:ABC transporter substrate-binding protein [Chloroflexota bacterium]
MNTKSISNSAKFLSLIVLAAILLAACSPAAPAAPAQPAAVEPAATSAPAASSEPIYLGVSGPLTGNNARYGAQWKKGFDLALEEINGAGGINGRKLEYIFEDSQADPKQSVVVAQKFIADERIVVELGDFSSTASMAASQIYQRAGLVQFGFTNSHPDFTKAGGDYTWSNSVTQAQAAPALADFAITTLGVKKLAIFYLNTDWGKSSFGLFSPRAKELGAAIVSEQAYLPDEKDFRSAITAVRDANPDGIILYSYQADGALIVQQLRDAGLKQPIIGGGSLQSPDFLKLGGAAVEDVYILGEFLASDPNPVIQDFVKKYQAKYNEEPDLFAVHAYDTINLIAAAIKLGGATRQGIHDALGKLKDVPSVTNGAVTFDLETRRVQGPKFSPIQVKGGKFVAWDGSKPVVSQ